MNALARWARTTASTLRITRRADAVVALVAIVFVGAVTTGIVAASRSVEQAEATSLADALAAAPPTATRLRVELADLFLPDAEPLRVPRSRIDDAMASVDPLVRSVYRDGRLVVDTPAFVAATIDGAPPASPTTLVMRVQEGLTDHASIVEGAMPAITDDLADGLPVVEVVVAEEAASDLGWQVGTEVTLGADTEDPLFRGFDTLPDPFVARVVGISRLDDITDPFWAGDPRLHRAIVDDTGVGADFTVHTTIVDEQLPALMSIVGGQSALRLEQRWDLDESSIDLSNARAVETAVRATSATTATTAPFGSPAVNLGLEPVLEDESARRAAASHAIAVAAVGLGAAAAAAFVQLQRAAAERRRPWWAQTRARGAGRTAMVTAALASMAVVVGIAVVVGVAVGVAVTPGSGGLQVTAVATLALSMLVVTTAVQVADVGSLDGAGSRPPQSSRRWVRAGATMVLVVGVASVVILRRGGIRAGDERFDPVVLLPIVFVPLALSMVAVTALRAAFGSRPLGHLDGGVGRLVGLRRMAAMHSAPALVTAVAVGVSAATAATVVAWTFGGDTSTALADVTRQAFVATAIGAWLLAVSTMAIASVVTMRRRRSDAALLSALGAPSGEFRAAVLVELVPLAALAVVTGGLAGAITVAALTGRLDLGALTGLDAPTAAVGLGGTVAVMATSFAAAVVVVRVCAGWVERRSEVS